MRRGTALRTALPGTALLALLLPGSLAATATPLAARLPDGRNLAMACAGAGPPTVLLEAGWSADHRAWGRVMAELARKAPHARVCGLDRAGSGGSDPGPLPRTGPAIAADAWAAVDSLRLPGPFILVGHSAGALYVRQMQRQRPRAVAGMLLIDPTVTDQDAQLAARFGAGAGSNAALVALARQCLAVARGDHAADRPAPARCRVNPPEAAEARWAARLSELENLGDASSAGLDVPLGALPLIVLTAGRGRDEAQRALWADLHGAIARLSSRGELRLVADSGHLMPSERPDAVADALAELVAISREPRPRRAR